MMRTQIKPQHIKPTINEEFQKLGPGMGKFVFLVLKISRLLSQSGPIILACRLVRKKMRKETEGAATVTKARHDTRTDNPNRRSGITSDAV